MTRWQKIITGFRKLFFNSRGSVTLESTIVFPTILLILFSLVFLSLFVYQKLVLLEAAVYTAKQRAATWDNSNKGLEDGFQAEFSGDGLYWRIFNDFRGSGLVDRKIKDSRSFLLQQLAHGVLKLKELEVDIQYLNRLAERTVSVNLTEKIIMPVNWLAGIFGEQVTVQAKAEVAEPVEFIRNLELAERYAGPLLNEMRNHLEKFKTGNQDKRPRPVVASTASDSNGVKVYHYAACPYAGRIKEGNRVDFASPAAAIGQGYRLCVYCAKREISP